MDVHSIIIEVFSKPGEDLEEIRTKLIALFPFDLNEEKITLQQKSAIGFNEQIIKTLRVNLQKQRHIKTFLSHLMDQLSDKTKEIILSQAEKRLDEDLYFYLRFDKKTLLQNNRYLLINEGDCFYFKLKVAAFPKKKDEALAIINNLFT
ncbi:MAG: hypothetical protein EU541_03605 [Promethearchaeota archaeon]|nr:MAG: hypothetical protein EU541_03605 [Candidatus Lokiarchaeota archaeon]